MLKGLEVSVVRLSELNNEHRIDAEYFSKENLHLNHIIQSYSHKKIVDFAEVTDGEHGSPNLDENSGILYLSGHNVKDNILDLTDIRYCSEKLHIKNIRSALQRNSVLLSIVGTVGNASVVYKDLKANTDRNVATIKNISPEVNPYYLSTFLNSRFGKYQTETLSTGNVQPLLNLLQVKSIKVCLPSTDFQQRIESLVKSAHAKLAESKSLYAQAEDALLSELGLKDWQPKNEAVSIKSFSDFASSGRLDAEYYQSKYDEIEERIKSVPHKTLNEIADIQDSNFNPKAKVAYKYIELANIGTSGEITGCTEDLGENLPSRARRVVHIGDVLVSSIEGSLQSCAIVSKDYDGALCSTGFYVLKAIDMNPESLLILLKTQIMQQLLKKGCSGTILTAISKDEFNRVIIPILPQDIQKQIAELIQTSFALRQESKQLLEQAKRMVEEEIEK